MNASHSSTSDTDRRPPQRGWALYGVAIGAVVGVMFAAVVPEGSDSTTSERVRLDTAPIAPAVRAAALDDGVDWAKVERSDDAGPRAVAAY